MPLKKNRKPLLCITTGIYYDSALSMPEECKTIPMLVNKAARSGQPYKGMEYRYITKEEFNHVKANYPDRAIGDSFIL